MRLSACMQIGALKDNYEKRTKCHESYPQHNFTDSLSKKKTSCFIFFKILQDVSRFFDVTQPSRLIFKDTLSYCVHVLLFLQGTIQEV